MSAQPVGSEKKQRPNKSELPNIPELMRSFLFSAIDHACSDAKSSFQLVNSKFDEWKQAKMNVTTEEQKMDEQYIIHYSNKRNEYEEAYKNWMTSRVEIMEKMKKTAVIGEQENLMKQLVTIPFPDILKTSVADIYTKYKPKQ